MELNRRDQLIEALGPTGGALFFDIEVAKRTKERDEWLACERRRAEKITAISVKRQAIAARLAPLQADADRKYQAWLAACEACEAARLAGEREVQPLQEEVAALTREMNRSPFEGRVKNWLPVPEADTPKLPPQASDFPVEPPPSPKWPKLPAA